MKSAETILDREITILGLTVKVDRCGLVSYHGHFRFAGAVEVSLPLSKPEYERFAQGLSLNRDDRETFEVQIVAPSES